MAGTILITLDNVWSAGSATMDIIGEGTRKAFPPECQKHVESLFDELELLQRIGLENVGAEAFNCFYRATRTAFERFRDFGPPPNWPAESYPNMIAIWTELLNQLEQDPRCRGASF
jgi:hypothetical protein